MPCCGLFGQALILSPIGQEEKIIREGSAATHPTPEQPDDSGRLRATSFQIALQVSNQILEPCSPTGEDDAQVFQWFLFTGKRGFGALELRTTKALFSLMITLQLFALLPDLLGYLSHPSSCSHVCNALASLCVPGYLQALEKACT